MAKNRGWQTGFTRYVSVLLFGILLTACAVFFPSKSEPVTITFVVITDPWLDDHTADYLLLAEAFHVVNPNIIIDVKIVDRSKLPISLSQADFMIDPEWSVDVVSANADLLPDMAESGLFSDIEPYIEVNQAVQVDDLIPSAMDTLRWQKRLYGLPAEMDPLVLYYNQDLFDLSGVPYPSDNWHWEDFLGTAHALASAPSVQFPFGSWGAEVTPFVYQNGVKLLDDTVPGEIRWYDLAAIEAIQWYVDLALVEGVMPTPQELAEYAMVNGRQNTIISAGSEEEKSVLQAQADLGQAIANGDVAMWMGPFSEQGGRFERWDFNWDYATLPRGRQSATLASVRGYFITAHTENVDDVLVWIDFLTQQLPLYGGLPVRRSAADQDAFYDLYEPRSASAYKCLLSLEESVIIPDFQDMFISQQIQGPILAVLTGEMTVDEALATLK